MTLATQALVAMFATMRIHPFSSVAPLLALLAACTPGGAGDEVGSSETGSSETGATSTSETSTSETGTSETSTSETGTSETGTSDTGTSDTGDPIVSTFNCEESGAVEPSLQLVITGGFTAASEPRDLLATHVFGGGIEFSAPIPMPVDPGDPNYDDVISWEAILAMDGWDVNMPADGTDDSRYFFLPSGAEGVSTFDAFYYRIYGAGGSGQFGFTCYMD